MAAYGSTQTILTRQGATPEQFGFGNSTELENFVDDLREEASSEVEEHCDRVFSLQQGETETVRGNGTQRIQVRNYPVVSINSIEVRAHTVDASAYQIVQTPGRTSMNAGIIERTDRRVWPDERLTVDYDWGLETPPGVVRSVVEDMVVEVLEKAVADRESSGKSSESMDGYSVSWDNSDIQQYLTLDEAKRKRLEGLTRQGVA